LIGKIQNSIGATENLMSIIQNEDELKEEQISAPIQKMKGDITFENVQFSYPSRKEVEVLKGISFEIKSGEQLAIVGGSGSGKSTIANLLLQFYPISNGDIKYDGKSFRDYELIQIRKNIAFVPQEVFLLGGTIEENIQYGMESATKEEIRNAAQKANALSFIEGFPEGFETIVGDRGIQLSGGQRQRIAIARAILRDPAILILDEATSALDSESEALVQEALEKLMAGRTSIVIAHRLSTIRKANKIIVLENGEIVEMGSHEELLINNNGRYQQLSALQQN
jgi:ABC-type multidrug transport system fused ATPase/permease subunit